MSTFPNLTGMTIGEALNVLALSPPDVQAEDIVERSMPLTHKGVRARARFIVACECPQSRYVVALADSLREFDRRQAEKPSRKTMKTEERVGPTLGELWGANAFGEFVSPSFGETDRSSEVTASSDASARSSDKTEG